MCVLAPLSVFVMNATMDLFRVVVLSVEEWEYLMPTTARSVPSRRKIGTGVPKLSTWGVPKLTCSMNGKNMASRKDEDVFLVILIMLLLALMCYHSQIWH